MRACRSLLYVPGDRPEMFTKAARSGADAIVIDLEDAVALSRKEEARANIRDWLQSGSPGCETYVRINAFREDPGLTYADLEFVVAMRLEGVFVPKLKRAEEVRRLDHILGFLEHRAGLAAGHVELGVIIETAGAAADCRSIAEASARIAAVVAGGGRDGDTARSLGYRWTASGEETWYLRSKVLLDARAAGVRYPLYSGWMEVRDLDGLDRDAQRTRDLGYVGQMVIHPSHVPVCNRAYGLSPDQIAYYRRVVDAFRAAQDDGRAAIEVDGRLIDKAMAVTAAEALEQLGDQGHG